MTEIPPDRDALLAHQRSTEFIDQNNTAAIEYAGAALRSLTLINGGAVVAILGFLAAISSGGMWSDLQIGKVISALTSFAYGSACAVATLGLSYCVSYLNAGYEASRVRTWQHPYLADGKNSKAYDKAGIFLHIIAVLVAVASLVLFLRGVYFTSAIFPGSH